MTSFQGSPLYKKASTGKLQVWQVSSGEQPDGSAYIETTYGQLDGKKQTARDVIREGKNIGKANETTPAQQAAAEAQALHEGKLKKGYVDSQDAALAGKRDAVIEGGIDPMLAQRYDDHASKIHYPVAVQRKFDGHRCIAVCTRDGPRYDVRLWSRTRKEINSVPHIVAALQKWCESLGSFVGNTLVLDGELYVHEYHNNFEELTSYLRASSPKPGHEVVQYHIYDLAQANISYKTRLEALQRYGKLLPERSPLVLVETKIVNDEAAMFEMFDSFIEEGYEGLMVRNLHGLYIGRRSYDLQKVKQFKDDDFEVVGVEEGRGKLAGCAMLICKSPAGASTPTFAVKMKGATENLATMWQHPESVIGRLLTVRYFSLTAANKVPRFPVGLRIREDI